MTDNRRAPSGSVAPSVLGLEIDVEPRKPRLAWQGMDRREAVAPAPAEVVEIVRPGRAVAQGDSLLSTAWQGAPPRRRGDAAPDPNRLIWTSDNVVALETLLDERDPATRDPRYRGKVDLVYIDPPFMVNSDFRADSAVDVEIDGEEGAPAKREPSPVEILAYKDTWREGLDGFLTMLRRRLSLLKDLLAPTGSIFVHLDWHVAHYVKVLMDELFGYDCFRAEIIWRYRRWPAKTQNLQRMHDNILYYRRTAKDEPKFNVLYEELAESTKQTFGSQRQLADFSSGHRKPGQVEEETPGAPLSDVWEIGVIAPIAHERVGYPTQKPLALLERILQIATDPGDLVLDCFSGSGTTLEAAERLGRRWIGVDSAKHAVNLTRKRLIRLHRQPRPVETPQFDHVACDACGNIKRKERPRKSPGLFEVRPFTVEDVGVYPRAGRRDLPADGGRHRDAMIEVFGGEPVSPSPLLHGRRGDAWVHVGPVGSAEAWSIAREVQPTALRSVVVLSADRPDTLSAKDRHEIEAATGVRVTLRPIPASAVEEVHRRVETPPAESMAVPIFYAPLAIVLAPEVSGKIVRLTLARCEIDVESFLAGQRPAERVLAGASAAARKKANAEQEKWAARRKELDRWLAKAGTWQKFVDYWAVDSDHGRTLGADGAPVFDAEWQSFRVRRSRGEVEPVVFTAELTYREAGRYRVAARVTDVFGNDGTATVEVEVKP